MPLQISFIDSVNQLTAGEWSTLSGHSSPFSKREFLQALEQQGCVGGKSGWTTQHIVIRDNDEFIGFIPCYQKSHSYGEYIFDWAWADAYRRHGLDYYPKSIVAIPFTPVTTNKLLLATPLTPAQKHALTTSCIEYLNNLSQSSIHWLFTDEAFNTGLLQSGYKQRRSVQFHWFNRDYNSFDAFLEQCTSRKRKNIKRERQKIIQAGIQVSALTGDDISELDLLFFYRCYQQTYLKRSGHGGYLTLGFFQQLLANMPENLLLVIAKQLDEPIAAALFLHDEYALYGRYWGALADIDGLHFECCLYQGIEFCIERSIPTFNPGTQGEHKISRGFEPVWCYSAHILADPVFHHAVERFILEENEQLEKYKQQAQALLPFKQ